MCTSRYDKRRAIKRRDVDEEEIASAGCVQLIDILKVRLQEFWHLICGGVIVVRKRDTFRRLVICLETPRCFNLLVDTDEDEEDCITC